MLDSLRELSGRMVVVLTVGYMAPMVIIWFLAPAIEWIAVSLGAPPGRGGRFALLGGVIPYPSPFTLRSALGVAIVVVPPAAFILLWMWSRRVAEQGARSR